MAVELPKISESAPPPVRMAFDVLEKLREAGELTEELVKFVPNLAMSLTREGREVTVDILLARARGEIKKDKQPETRPAKTYAEVVANLRPASARGEMQDVYRAILRDDLAAFVEAGSKSFAPTWEELADCFSMAGARGNATAIKWLFSIHDQIPAAGPQAQEIAAEKHRHVFVMLNEAVVNGRSGALLTILEEMNRRKLEPPKLSRLLAYAVHADKREAGLTLAVLPGHLVHDDAAAGMPGLLRNAAASAGPAFIDSLVKRGYIGIDDLQELAQLSVHHGRAGLAAHLKAQYDISPAPLGGDGEAWENDVANGAYNGDAALLDLIEDAPGREASPLLAQARRDRAAWREITGEDPPEGLFGFSDPRRFDAQAFGGILEILREEQRGYPDLWSGAHGGKNMARTAALLQEMFGSAEQVLRYLEKWGDGDMATPLRAALPALDLLSLPQADWKAWGSAALQLGPPMIKLMRAVDKVPAPARADNGKEWSIKKTREQVAPFAYPEAQKNLALAQLCLEHDVSAENFAKALDVSARVPETKTVPDIDIDGGAFGMPGAKFYRLPTGDVRGLFLGEITDCCQSIGGEGEYCAINGYESPEAGFYVIEDARGRIIGQSWGWRGTKGELVLDSLETLGERVSDRQWSQLMHVLGAVLDCDLSGKGVTALHIGVSGFAGTPQVLKHSFKEAVTPAQPRGHDGYIDSEGQRIVWQRPRRRNDMKKQATP